MAALYICLYTTVLSNRRTVPNYMHAAILTKHPMKSFVHFEPIMLRRSREFDFWPAL
jgi:hypothetical protein